MKTKNTKEKQSDLTDMKDDEGNEIKVGDILISEWDYKVKVTRGKDNSLFGKLVCDKKHPCYRIPYDLNSGKGYRKEV
jgi:hypothetical protein